MIKWAVAALEELLNRSETCVPRVKELVVDGRFKGYKAYEYWHNTVARLLRVTNEKGIETAVLHNDFDHSRVERGWGMDETVEWGKCEGQDNEKRLRKVWKVER